MHVDSGFDAREKHQSQIPALQLLVALGFAPLSQAEAVRQRGGRLRNVVLDDVLVEQLLKINRFTYRGKEYPFDLEDAHEALRRLKPTPDKLKGLRGTNQDIYDQLDPRHDDHQDDRRRQQELFVPLSSIGRHPENNVYPRHGRNGRSSGPPARRPGAATSSAS